MPGPSGKGPAPRELPFPTLGDTPDAEADLKALAEALSAFAKFNQGLLAARPATGASKEGDFYWATDDVTYGPTGTVWVLKAGAWVSFPLPTVVTAMIAAEAISTAKIANLAVTAAKIANNTITGAQIANATITATQLAGEAVETGGIKGLAVTAAKIAAEAIETAKIKLEAITTALIANLAVTEPKLGAEAVSEGKIKNLAVTAAKIAANTITGAKIAAEAIETAAIKAAAVTAPKLGLGTIRQEGEPPQAFVSWGQISEAGVIEASSGDFTIAKITTGEYEIKWTKEKTSLNYACVVTPWGGTLPAVGAVTAPAKKTLTIHPVEKTGVAINAPFTFIVIAAS